MPAILDGFVAGVRGRRLWWVCALVGACAGVAREQPPAVAEPSQQEAPAVVAKTPAPPLALPPKAPDAKTVDPAPPAAVVDVGPPLPKFPLRPPPYKVLIIGDSMAATDFGQALERRLKANRQVSVARRGKSATGLARPDYFDWTAESAKNIKRHDPDLVVVIIGGNDGQDLKMRPGTKDRRRVFWNSDNWSRSYSQRTTEFCLQMLAEHRRVLWLELPVMDHSGLETKLRLIRSVQREAIERLMPRVQYLETRQHFVDAKDQTLRSVKVKGYKRPQTLRQSDGIHFTVPGSRYFANRIAPKVLEALGIKEDGP